MPNPLLVSLIALAGWPAGMQTNPAGSANAVAEPGVTAFSEVRVVAIPSRRSRSLVRTDPIEALLVKGRPGTGDVLALPDGGKAEWEAVEFDARGRIEHAALASGYAAATVRSDRDHVVILQADGHSVVVVNGRSLAGDPYGRGFVALPVRLREGVNRFLFRCARGHLSAKMETPTSELMILEKDTTLPDLVVGESDKVLGAVVVLNATNQWVRDAVIRVAAQSEGGPNDPITTNLSAIPPLSVSKAPFTFNPPAGLESGGSVALHVAVSRSAGLPVCEEAFTLRVRTGQESRRRTFISSIDGSVQYYTVQPRKRGVGDESPSALFLTLHGAGVKSQRQAACYSPKDWGDVVAPTNRRSFGFDWEDWGRIDALEVLDLASTRLKSDPNRVYLTGHGMGGHGTWQLGVLFPDRFAAIAPSAGWVSFRSYTGAPGDAKPDPVMAMLRRAAKSSDTLALLRNTLHYGVYVLHGQEDDNVPVSEARTMREQLARLHPNFAYYERPGAGHWWGNQCMDWPPLFDFLRQNVRTPSQSVDRVEFVTVHPAISDGCHWVSIRAQERSLEPSLIDVKLDRKKGIFEGTTQNVRRLAFDLNKAFGGSIDGNQAIRFQLDGTEIGAAPAESMKSGSVSLTRMEDSWAFSTPEDPRNKGPHRAGPFKEAFRNGAMLVVGTAGSAAENAWALNKARFDSETFWYRGNGTFEITLDKEFDPAEHRDLNVILYGNAETNVAWNRVLRPDCPVRIDRTGITVGDRRLEGSDLALLAVYPRKDSNVASVGIVGGAGLEGCRTTDRLPLFVSGVGIPDWVVISSAMFKEGANGIRAAGFFDHAWQVDAEQSTWRNAD